MSTAPTRVLGLALASAAFLAAAGTALAATDPALEKRVDALLAKMTLEEKIGQLHQLSRSGDPTGPTQPGRPENAGALVREGRLGSMLNVVDPKEAAALQALARQSRLGIPLILGLDVIHGFRTVFPVPLAEASSWDPGLAERTAEIAGREAAAVGIHWTFAPMVDIARDPRWGRIVAGEDPHLGAAFAAARVRGFRKGGLEVKVKVKNAGERAGKEVVQLYVRGSVASRSRPLRELKGFRKVALGPGEEKEVAFSLAAQDLGFHDDAGKYLVEPGEFQVFVGGSSLADLTAGFEVKGR